MSDTKKAAQAQPEEKKDIDYSAEIDKLRETEPHKNTNKYIKSLIEEATGKVSRDAYSKGFWNGFVLGVVIAFIFWTVLTF